MSNTDQDADKIDTVALELLPALKDELTKYHLPHNDDDDDDEYLLMFLRWKQDVKRAADRYRSFVEWKRSKENVGVFDTSLRLSEDPALEKIMTSEVIIAPPTLTTLSINPTGNGNDDDGGGGGPVLIGRLRNNDMKDGRRPDDVVRMMFYTIDQTLAQRPEMQRYGATIIHDLRGFDPARNASPAAAKKLFSALLGHFPIRINAIYMYKAPWAFSNLFFPLLSKTIMSKKVRQRVRFISSLDEIKDVVDLEQLPEELLRDDFGRNGSTGGDGDGNDGTVKIQSKLDWDIQDWITDQKQKETDVDSFRSLTLIGGNNEWMADADN